MNVEIYIGSEVLNYSFQSKRSFFFAEEKSFNTVTANSKSSSGFQLFFSPVCNILNVNKYQYILKQIDMNYRYFLV